MNSTKSIKPLLKKTAEAPPAGPRFAPRPFALQAKAVDAPDLETRQKQAERFGHRFPPEAASPGRDEGSIAGLPRRLRLGIEALSGLSMKDVLVHYDSSRPARVEAHAFAQGRDIHLAPGQEEHLAHEAWHVVQQKQQRVRPTFSLRGLPVNEQEGLEQEAETMGRQALQAPLPNHVSFMSTRRLISPPALR